MSQLPPAADDAPIVQTPHRYVVVEGPIGVGKTSLARRLAASFGSDLVLEQGEENPFLERFYRNPRGAAFQTQLYFLFQRARQLQDLRQQDMFQRVRVADYLLDKDRLFARLTLDDEEYGLYEQVYARLAGQAGMGYSFASHFSPTPARPAFDAYRAAFRPSAAFAAPHAILGVSAICAPTDDEAQWLASAMELAWVRLRSGILAALPSPEEAAGYVYNDAERRLARGFRDLVVVGTPEDVRRDLLARAADADASELMIVCNMHDHAARLRSFELIAEALAD